MLPRALLPLAPAASLSPLALVREVGPPTPLEATRDLAPPPREVLLKREDTGPNGAFKWRGALCACAAFRAGGARAIVTASTGNHGAATAWAAARLGLEAHIVVPADANDAKCALIARNGARLHRHGRLLDDAVARAAEMAAELDAPLFEDGACEAQLRGTETIGLELLAARADTVVTPLACGALAGGLARALAAATPRPRVIGVQSSAFGRLGAVWRGEPDPLTPSGTSFADGLTDNRIVEPAFSACAAYLDDVLEVDDEALLQALRELHRAHGIVVEGAAAAPLAALRTQPERIPGKRIVLVVSGCNVGPGLAEQILGA